MLRMPATDEPLGVGPIAMANWQEATGSFMAPTPNDPQAKNWRRRAITELTREIAEAVRRVRPDIAIWIAVETTGDLGRGFEETPVHTQMLQSWPQWVEEGLCDGIVLKSRHNLRSEDGMAALRSWIAFAQGVAGGLPVIVSLSGAENYQSPLFDAIHDLRRAENPVNGIALWHHSDPARDAGPTFYTNLRRAVFQERGRFQFDAPDRRPVTTPMEESTAALASIEMPEMDTSALDEALGLIATGVTGVQTCALPI